MPTPSVDAALERVAARQHGVLRLAHLRSAGLDPRAISRRVRGGRLHRVYRGVYVLHRGLSREGRWLAAVFAAGHGAALSHLCAAALWCLREIRTDFVTVVAPKHRVPKGPLRVHECRKLDPRDVTSCSARRSTLSSDIRLNVEVDGSQHRRRRTRCDDERRDARLEAGGYSVLRFTAFEVQERPDQMRATLESARRRLGG